ncbi:hypothetical protein KM92DES2_20072 [uncultured Desulfovibrio sp.]|uniref:Uncharacterized protein n=1 Tax=uncultured Desulfovibrio sp. TaxID=167968 RepID=A0A212KIH2_9BACT|nr:hypothetical protein [uncultured Desulfovibrio sp.]SBW11441.1 hypothetical protein KM92DES2_20072 [uncultured Desulfovibrio sp.]
MASVFSSLPHFASNPQGAFAELTANDKAALDYIGKDKDSLGCASHFFLPPGLKRITGLTQQ